MGFPSLSYAFDPYIYGNSGFSQSNYGVTGLIQMPNARFSSAGTVGLVYADFYPNQKLSFFAAPFHNLEATYHYTNLENRLYSAVYEFSGNQTAKDKGFDLKVKLLDESKYYPSIALGLRDIGGTGLFSSEYFVVSKFYKSIDFSLGIGWGNMARQSYSSFLEKLHGSFATRGDSSDTGEGGKVAFKNFFSGDMGIFGGAELRIPYIKNTSFKLEYDSTNYLQEGFSSGNPYIKAKQAKYKSNWNIGINYKPTKQTSIGFSSIGSEQFSFNFSYLINLAKKNPVTSKSDVYKPISNKENLRKATALDNRYLYLSALKYFKENKISLRSLSVSNEKLKLTFSQNTHLSYPRAYGRIARLLDDMSPESIKYFELVAMNSDYELAKITIPRESFNKYKELNYHYLLGQEIILEEAFKNYQAHDFKPAVKYPVIFSKATLASSSFLGGPDRFAVFGLGARADIEILFKRNISWKTVLHYKLYNSFDVIQQGSESLLPAVRTNSQYYMKTPNRHTIQRSQLNYFKTIDRNIYGKLSAGLFEEMFGGIGGEILYRDFNKNWAIGADIYAVKQRDFDQLFSFKKYNTVTGHVNFYYKHPSSLLLLKVSAGKYLAKDSGFTFDFSRRFKSGMRLGAFFTLTDVSDEEFGEGSFDKGFYIDLPLEILFPFYTRELTSFGLRPITRDGGAKLMVGYDLYGVTDEGSLYSIQRDFEDFYD